MAVQLVFLKNSCYKARALIEKLKQVSFRYYQIRTSAGTGGRVPFLGLPPGQMEA
jgi:hypothetical protein